MKWKIWKEERFSFLRWEEQSCLHDKGKVQVKGILEPAIFVKSLSQGWRCPGAGSLALGLSQDCYGVVMWAIQAAQGYHYQALRRVTVTGDGGGWWTGGPGVLSAAGSLSQLDKCSHSLLPWSHLSFQLQPLWTIFVCPDHTLVPVGSCFAIPTSS